MPMVTHGAGRESAVLGPQTHRLPSQVMWGTMATSWQQVGNKCQLCSALRRDDTHSIHGGIHEFRQLRRTFGLTEPLLELNLLRYDLGHPVASETEVPLDAVRYEELRS